MSGRDRPLASSILFFASMLGACADDSDASDSDAGTETDATTDTTDTDSTDSGSATDTTTATTSSGTTGPETDSATSGDPACGDGTVDDGEECDDGNIENGDACTADCTVPVTAEWTFTHNGADNGNDNAAAVAIDDTGNIYVVGREFTAAQSFDLWLVKLDPAGQELDSITYDGMSSGQDSGAALAWHPTGDLLVAGGETVTDQDSNILFIRLSPADLSISWSARIDGPMSGEDFASGITADGDGNIYVTGYVSVMDQLRNTWFGKFDGDGMEVWTDTYDGPASSNDYGRSILVDDDGNIYVGGSQWVNAAGSDAWLRKMDPDGMELWTVTNSLLVYDQGINAMSFTPDGNVLVAGFEEDDGVGLNGWIRLIDPSDGATVWSRTYDGKHHSDDSIVGLAVATDGQFVVNGFHGVMGESANLWTRKYTDMGEAVWTATYNNDSTNLDEIGTGIAFHPDGGIVAVGRETVLGQGTNAWVRKYVEP